MDTTQQHHEDERADDTGADDTTPLAMAPSRPMTPPSLPPLPVGPRASAAARTNGSGSPRSGTIADHRSTTMMMSRGSVSRATSLVGFDAIQKYLAHLGMPADIDIYRLRREKLWPIGKTAGTGGSLIASKRRLARYAQKLTAPSKSDAA